jgi:hypothetical protein
MIQIFVSYSHYDSRFVEGKTSLLRYLSGIEAGGRVRFWFDKLIDTGAAWDQEIQRQIKASRIALVLISQWFLDSAYIREVEIKTFMQRRRTEGMIVFPVLLASCDWQEHEWLAGTQCLPRNGRTVSQHYKRRERREALYHEIRQGLMTHIKRLEREDSAASGLRAMDAWLDPQKHATPVIGNAGDRTAFLAVEHLLDAGDRVSAINAILRGGEFAEAGREEQLDVVVICQKLGFLEDARTYLTQVAATGSARPMPLEVKARFKLAELKLLGQEGRFEEVLDLYPAVLRLLSRSGQGARAPQAHHRAGIAHAVLRHPGPASMCFNKAIRAAVTQANPHAAMTCRLMLAIAQAFNRVPQDGSLPLDVIVASQETYLAEPISRVLWQANRLKSAVQALFTEAAVLLEGRSSYGAGWVRLTVAHLLARQAGSSPTAEGYSELLSLIETARVRDLARAAMRTDDAGRHAFQQHYLMNATYLTACQKCVAILTPPDPDTWRQLRAFLSELDVRYGEPVPGALHG